MDGWYAVIGNWRLSNGERGISTYRYENGEFEFTGKWMKEINAGAMAVIPGKDVFYVADEIDRRPGHMGGGGTIYAVRLDREKGTIHVLNHIDTLMANPAYLCLDKNGRYLVAVHHGTRHCVTKVTLNNGIPGAEEIFGDSGLELFSIEEDGSLGKLCDLCLMDNSALPVSVLHYASFDPTGSFFVTTDVDKDRVYSYRIDYDKEKLVCINTVQSEQGKHGRYGAFAAGKKIFYKNNERYPEIDGYRYDEKSGKLTVFLKKTVLEEEIAKDPSRIDCSASDMKINQREDRLYVSVRSNFNCILVFGIEEDGSLTQLQQVPCGGVSPRWLSFTPEGDYLLSANDRSGNVAIFRVEADGALTEEKRSIKDVCPGIVQFL